MKGVALTVSLQRIAWYVPAFTSEPLTLVSNGADANIHSAVKFNAAHVNTVSVVVLDPQEPQYP